MIFRELSNADFRFSLRRPGAEIMGGGRSNAPPAGGGKSRGPAGRGLIIYEVQIIYLTPILTKYRKRYLGLYDAFYTDLMYQS